MDTFKAKKKSWLSMAILILFLLAISFHYHRGEITKYPSYIHAWAQADHYALALGFTENGYDFFHPQTYNLNKQFPNNFMHPYPTGVTSADFPIHAYIPAILMGLTGSTSPFWVRIYLLIYSLVGLVFLFLLAKELSQNYIAPFAVVAFAALSPVFLYYQATFLPTIPSLANAIIGYFFYTKHLKEGKLNHFWLALVFFTLGALARTPFAIFLTAILCLELLFFILKKKINAAKCIGFLGSIGIILGYFCYNQHLRSVNGSIFLNHLAYPNSFEEYKTLFSIVTDQWGNHYLTRFQYLFFLVLVVSSIVMTILRGKERDSLRRKFAIQVIIASFGAILYSIVMAKQYVDHDYYMLDSLFLPFILLIALLLGQFALNSQRKKGIAICLVLVFTVAFQLDAHKRVKDRQQALFWDKYELINQNFEKSEQLINSLKISKEDTFLVLDSQSPNQAFTHMKRKGYGILNANRENVEKAIKWNYDYIVVQNCFFYPDLVEIYPEILQHVERVGGNDNITILRRSKEPKTYTLHDILGLQHRALKLQSTTTLDKQPNTLWSNTNSIKAPSDTLNRVGYTNRDNEWSITFTLSDSALQSMKSIYPIFTAKFFSNEKAGKVFLMANYEVGNVPTCQQVFPIELNEENAGQWRQITFVLPAIRYVNNGKANRYTLFLWNCEKKEFSYDNVSVSIY